MRIAQVSPLEESVPPRRYGGTGLGLATVHGIVHQSQGWIDVCSELGRGSTFEIHFPAAAGRPVGEALQTEAVSASGRETILLVEDEEAARTTPVWRSRRCRIPTSAF